MSNSHICMCICACAHVQGIGDVCLKCRSTKPSVTYSWMALLPDETESEREGNGETELNLSNPPAAYHILNLARI